MNPKLNTITSLRWGLLPYTAGSGLHVGVSQWGGRVFPNAIGIEPDTGPGVDLRMNLHAYPLFASGVYDFVVIGDALTRVPEPRKTLAECWRVLGDKGYLAIVRPTAVAYEWMLEDCADYVVHANFKFGAQRVDVLQKLPAGEGRHHVPAIEGKTCAIVRTGGYGDALWASSILPALKDEGYHVTIYLEAMGEEVLREDPHVDRILVTDEQRLQDSVIGAFWAHETARYDRWINLVECVEKNLLAVPTDLRFYWPAEERRRMFGGNYLEATHRLAGVPRKFAQKFYPTKDEVKQAIGRQTTARKSCVFAVSGSTLPKFWPYVDELVTALIARGYAVWVMGELRGLKLAPREHLSVVGRDWSIREALAFAQHADLVVGQETGILNAVAFEPMRKVVLLSHSTAKNLTRDWTNTVALHGTPPCWPCHQIHYLQNGWEHCNQDPVTKLAKCQATISVDQVLEAVDKPFVIRGGGVIDAARAAGAGLHAEVISCSFSSIG
jgi:ADP-heptose:LPS heptosyltransferase